MTFGQIKTITENYLLSSYGNKESFKTALLEFKKDILDNKNISKIYSLYSDLSTPQGMNEKEAQEFLDEGIKLIQSFIKEVKLPKVKLDNELNNYKEIDDLVYIQERFSDLKNTLDNKKKVVSLLMRPKKQINEGLKIPLSSMVNIANKNLKEYINSLDESAKMELSEVLSEDQNILKSKFEDLKKYSVEKLTTIKESETKETKEKIEETIRKIEGDDFNSLNYLRLKKLSETL